MKPYNDILPVAIFTIVGVLYICLMYVQSLKLEMSVLKGDKAYWKNAFENLNARHNVLLAAISKDSKKESPYHILGLQNNASLQEVKNKYRTLLKRFHPDINKEKDSAEVFRKIQDAYKTIMKLKST